MEVFRDNGFAGTSTQMLVDELGINRFSLYSEFENKQKLFDATLERYDNRIVEKNFGPLEASNAGIDEIRSLFQFFAAAIDGPSAGRGCLLCNTAVEFGPQDPTGSGFVQQYFTRISNAFNNALENASRSGVIHHTISVREEADFLTAAVLGLFVMIRAKAPDTILKNAVKKADEHLNRLSI